MMRKTLIVANWKMHLNVSQASIFVHRLEKRLPNRRDIEVVLAAPSLDLQPLSLEIDRRKLRLAAQNAYHQDEGPYTGEISFMMLRDIAQYCIIGHSERRKYFNEDLPMIRDKVAAAIRNDITPILCVGETQVERREGMGERVVHDQLTTALSNLTARGVSQMVVCYEPVWAISTFEGELAKPADVAKAIGYIRHQISRLYGHRVAKDVRVIYGGSVDSSTVAGYLQIEACEGALVGGASLNPYHFADIIDVTCRLKEGGDAEEGK